MTTFNPMCFLSFLALAGETAMDGAGTAANQYYLLVAIGTLAAVTVYQHKANQAAEKSRADADVLRFNRFTEHHEELIKKIDEERAVMTQERIGRIEMLMSLVSQNAVANEKQAAAINGLTSLIRERISPLIAQPAATHQS